MNTNIFFLSCEYGAKHAESELKLGLHSACIAREWDIPKSKF